MRSRATRTVIFAFLAALVLSAVEAGAAQAASGGP